jgi:hypothetical protein
MMALAGRTDVLLSPVWLGGTLALSAVLGWFIRASARDMGRRRVNLAEMED